MTPRFVALGDSITEGYGIDAVAGIDSIPWAQRVADELGLELHNLARRRLRAAEIRERQLAPALALEPDLVAVAAGANDMLEPDFSQDRVIRDLEPIYAAFAETPAHVFTFTYMNLPGSGLLPDDGARWLAQRMEALHAVVRSLAEGYGAQLIDIYADPRSADPRFFSADLQHANAAGHLFVARETIAALRKGWPRLARGDEERARQQQGDAGNPLRREPDLLHVEPAQAVDQR